MTLTKLSIVNFSCYAYHGVSDVERQLGGKYQVDIDLWYDAKQAVASDSLSASVNYQNVLYVVSDFIQNENYKLIETLANSILEELLKQFNLLEEIVIRIRKCNVPMQQVVDYVQVESHIKRRERKSFKA